jgi:hypothetical protein
MNNEIFVNILLSILGFIGVMSVKQLMSIAKSIHEIKNEFSVMSTKHDYLENRVKDIEIKINKN